MNTRATSCAGPTPPINLRSQIAGFDPSEEEFRTVFKLKRAFDEEYGEIGINLDLLEEQLKAQKTLNEQIRQSLGDERYADYERAQDYQFQQIHSSLKKPTSAPARRFKCTTCKKSPKTPPCNCGETRRLTKPSGANAYGKSAMRPSRPSASGWHGRLGEIQPPKQHPLAPEHLPQRTKTGAHRATEPVIISLTH